jgi:hypothetical protein
MRPPPRLRLLRIGIGSITLKHHHHHNNAQETVMAHYGLRDEYITEQAAEYGIRTQYNEHGYLQFIAEQDEVLCWMVNNNNNQWHAYSAGGDSYVGGKRSAANWCLDIAVNGEK